MNRFKEIAGYPFNWKLSIWQDLCQYAKNQLSIWKAQEGKTDSDPRDRAYIAGRIKSWSAILADIEKRFNHVLQEIDNCVENNKAETDHELKILQTFAIDILRQELFIFANELVQDCFFWKSKIYTSAADGDDQKLSYVLGYSDSYAELKAEVDGYCRLELGK